MGLARAEPYPIKVEAVREPFGDVLRATNGGAVAMSVSVTLELSENLASDAAWPLFVVVPAQSTQVLARLGPSAPMQPWRYRYTWRYRAGPFDALPDASAIYRLPYGAFPIVQGLGGPLSTHTTPNDRDALDIAMPEGTPVFAAREGIVIEALSEFRAGGDDERLRAQANMVRVLHADGTIGNYAHLAYRGVASRAGDFVRAGDLIGYSGSTGYSRGPHLHFGVTRVVRAGGDFTEVSVPFAWQR